MYKELFGITYKDLIFNSIDSVVEYELDNDSEDVLENVTTLYTISSLRC